MAVRLLLVHGGQNRANAGRPRQGCKALFNAVHASLDVCSSANRWT